MVTLDNQLNMTFPSNSDPQINKQGSLKESVNSSGESTVEIPHAVLASKLYKMHSKFGKDSEKSYKNDLWPGNQTETKEV